MKDCAPSPGISTSCPTLSNPEFNVEKLRRKAEGYLTDRKKTRKNAGS